MTSREQWMTEAILEQEIYCSLLGNRAYDTFTALETRNLRKKLAFAMFDKPRLEPSCSPAEESLETSSKVEESLESSSKVGGRLEPRRSPVEERLKPSYKAKECLEPASKIEEHLEPSSKAERRRLDKICAMIRKEKGAESDYKVGFVSVLYVTRSKRSYACVVRVPNGDSPLGYKFIDDKPRTYATWSDYLKNNRLPKCVMCFPDGGIYREGCEFLFAKSPACRVVKDIGRGLYGASIALGAGAGFVTTAALFVPITVTVLSVAIATSVASGAFVAGRSISGLRDRDAHGQTLALRSSEARTHWFGLLSFVFDSVAATTSVLKSAAIVARSKRVIAQLGNAVKLSAQTVKALRVANFIASAMKRLGNKAVITRVDLLYLVDAIYFFCNVVLTLDDVGYLVALINDAECDIFEECFDRNDHVTDVEMRQIGVILRILGQYEPDGSNDENESTDL